MKQTNCMVICTVLLLVSCGSTLNRHQARDVIKGMPELKQARKDIEVTGVISAGTDRAVVSANMKLAFLMANRDGKWEVDEIRLSDRQWVNVERLRNVLSDLRELDTRQAMLELAEGLVRRLQAAGTFPATADLVTLTDQLHPAYLTRLIRSDAWGTDFQYQQLSGGSRYKLISAGPDRTFQTADDLVMMDGRILSPGASPDPD